MTMAQEQVPMMNMCPCPGQGLFYIGPPSPFPKPHDHWSFHDYWNKGTSSKLKGYSAFEITDGCIADSTPGSEDGQVCHGNVCRGSSSASVGTDTIAGGFEVIFAASTDYTQYEWEVACPSLLDTMIINREECSCGEADCSVFIDGKDDVGLGGVTYFPENKYRAKIELVANGSCGGPTATVSMTIRCGESINILNPGFEEETTTGILDDWNDFVDGYKISTTEKFSGAKSLEVDLTPSPAPGAETKGGVFQSFTRSFPLGLTFYSYGFSKAMDVQNGISAGNYAVFIDYRTDPGNNCANQPGTWDGCGEKAAFDGTNTDWTFSDHFYTFRCQSM